MSFAARRRRDRAFRVFCRVCAWSSFAVLAVLLGDLLWRGAAHVSWDFLTSFPSRMPERAGIKAALAGSLWLMVLTMLVATPVGFASAIYLEEYSRRGRLSTFIEINIANLAGVPSIIYGILGLALFVRGMALGRSLIAGALTMALLILPVIIIAAREAIRAVPPSHREASYALGATRWQTTSRVVLPAALPGILTGYILATSRAIGETAPLILIGALSYVAFVPRGPMDSFTALPIQVFNWASRPQTAFQTNAAAGILVLLAVLFVLNSVAIWMRQRWRREV
ncbi:MAG: phosphate ABC transporter permease PstA [Candidatus Sumerlaeia bacterium]|nr:phosphate ABC transporter permease PstA [Candidatus Sumerlaeia bacterium]